MNNSGRTFNADRPYKVRVTTCNFHGAGTDSTISARLIGRKDKESDWTELDISGYQDLERGDDDVYGINVPNDFGPPCSIEFKTSGGDAWAVCRIQVQGPDGTVYFTADHSRTGIYGTGTPRWLSNEEESHLKDMPLSIGSFRSPLYTSDGYKACISSDKKQKIIKALKTATEDYAKGKNSVVKVCEDEDGNATVTVVTLSEDELNMIPDDPKCEIIHPLSLRRNLG
ncbi:PLAT/LH2 domain-containing protein [Streptomyces sp. NPDC051162]|uniref:PLAT/LH2 domain-containing protein n=1 Tax=unclassified Streptomyces TaxID=2593676 RepID=UPI003423D5ED